jgi:hypothetical protein
MPYGNKLAISLVLSMKKVKIIFSHLLSDGGIGVGARV